MLREHTLLVPEQMSSAGIWLDPTSLLAHPMTNQKVESTLSSLFRGLRSPIATVSNGGLVIGGAVASVLHCPILPIKKRGDCPRPRVTGAIYANSTVSGEEEKPSKQLCVHLPDVVRVIDPLDPDTYVFWLLDDMKDRGRTLHAARELIEGLTIHGISPCVAGAIVIVERVLEDDEPEYWDNTLPLVSLLRGTKKTLKRLATTQRHSVNSLLETREVEVHNGVTLEMEEKAS
jgi:adenine/guanine phosphoribosyltransferase-like PRPP-binding protein